METDKGTDAKRESAATRRICGVFATSYPIWDNIPHLYTLICHIPNPQAEFQGVAHPPSIINSIFGLKILAGQRMSFAQYP
jgi:hypothetical protein